MTTENITGRVLWRKILVLGLIGLGLMIPIFMVDSLASERKNYRAEVIQGLVKSWGNSSWYGGLYLQPSGSNKLLTLKGSEVSVKMKSSLKKRGLYEIPVYTAEIKTEGRSGGGKTKYRLIQFVENAYELSPLRVKVGEAKVALYAVNNIELQSAPLTIAPGTKVKSNFTSHGLAKWTMAAQAATKTSVTTDWPDLSFFGTMLPASSDVDATGENKATTAEWLRHRKIPAVVKEPKPSHQWTGRSGEVYKAEQDEFGLALFGTENIYTQTDRLLKYSFLFLFLTIGLFFLHEIYYKIRIHPIEYGLVGLALALFYLIVLSVSEHISFDWAYLFGAVIVAGMLHFYTGAVLKRPARVLTTVIATLYTILYILLCLETFSLLVGTFFLVVLLGLVMFFTRHIDWYNLELSKSAG